MSRRKTKTERELNTDIHDTFRIFCNKQWMISLADMIDALLV